MLPVNQLLTIRNGNCNQGFSAAMIILGNDPSNYSLALSSSTFLIENSASIAQRNALDLFFVIFIMQTLENVHPSRVLARK